MICQFGSTVGHRGSGFKGALHSGAELSLVSCGGGRFASSLTLPSILETKTNEQSHLGFIRIMKHPDVFHNRIKADSRSAGQITLGSLKKNPYP